MLGGISENMVSLGKLGKCGAINAEYTTAMGYYVGKYWYETYALQEYKTIDGQKSKAGELLVKSEYLSVMKAKTIVIENKTEWNIIS